MRMRHNDYPITEVAAQAATLHARTGADVYQKWTCCWCGSRQGMDVPNTFYVVGVCEECRRITEIEHCNFMVIYGRNPLREREEEKNR